MFDRVVLCSILTIAQSLPDGRAHNVLTNDATNFAYVVGARPRTSECRSGLIFLDLSGKSTLLAR